MRLTLKPRPDTYGFIYGTVEDESGQSHRVNIMPPLSEWRGDMKLPDYEPHAIDWVIYADDEEIARVTKRGDLEAIVAQRLLT